MKLKGHEFESIYLEQLKGRIQLTMENQNSTTMDHKLVVNKEFVSARTVFQFFYKKQRINYSSALSYFARLNKSFFYFSSFFLLHSKFGSLMQGKQWREERWEKCFCPLNSAAPRSYKGWILNVRPDREREREKTNTGKPCWTTNDIEDSVIQCSVI